MSVLIEYTLFAVYPPWTGVAIACNRGSFTDIDKLQSNHGYIIACPVTFGKKSLIHYQTSTVAPLKFVNKPVISLHAL